MVRSTCDLILEKQPSATKKKKKKDKQIEPSQTFTTPLIY